MTQASESPSSRVPDDESPPRRALESAIEELRSTQEELRVQNEELRMARDEIEAERQRYADLLEVAPLGYLVTDISGVVREANHTSGELLGRQVRDLLGKPLVDLVGPEWRVRLRALVREAAAGRRWQDEVPFVRADGGRARMLVNVAGPVPGAEQRIRWSLAELPGSAGRLVGRGDLAAARRLVRHRLSALLDRLQDGVVAVDSTLRVSYANSSAESVLTEGGNLVGQTLPDPWPEPSLRTLTSRMFEHRAEPAEARAELDDGRVFDVLALPPDVSGEALLVVADSTSHERQQRAERDFVANAAHQLRTPVSAIASAVEVLQGGAKEDPESRDRFLAHLDRQCMRLVTLTRALLLLARAQALSEPPAVEIVPLRSLLRGIARPLRPGKGIKVRVECPPDLAVLANRDLLEQALGNLAENAAKYTAEGEIVLAAEGVSEEHVRIVVSDTGPGSALPADGNFRRFYRDPDAQGEGFGLGVAIAAEALRVLGGELRIDSTSSGTSAYTTLPAAQVRKL